MLETVALHSPRSCGSPDSTVSARAVCSSQWASTGSHRASLQDLHNSSARRRASKTLPGHDRKGKRYVLSDHTYQKRLGPKLPRIHAPETAASSRSPAARSDRPGRPPRACAGCSTHGQRLMEWPGTLKQPPSDSNSCCNFESAGRYIQEVRRRYILLRYLHESSSPAI